MSSLPPLVPRCFFCETLLTPQTAKILLPSGKVYGECCADLADDLDQVTPE